MVSLPILNVEFQIGNGSKMSSGDKIIDLRSDTVTKPVPEMREVMAQAEVGDDVYGEDPTVNELEGRAAKIFGRENSIFVPSGTMGNQISVNVHTEPGNEVILDYDSHIFNYELGTMANFSSVIPRPIEASEVYLPLKKVRRAVRPEKYYISQTGLVTLENTHNVKGGAVYPREKAEEILSFVERRGLPIHLDAARIFNAAVATEKRVKDLAKGFDSVMFCLSKGLGAPIGSMLVGDDDFIERARKVRKQLGGGVRQAGIIAAAGLFALEKHVDRLEEDHRNAQLIADGLKDLDGVEVTYPDTNILVFRLVGFDIGLEYFIRRLSDEGVLAGTIGVDKVRFVTHLDISRREAEEALNVTKSILETL